MVICTGLNVTDANSTRLCILNDNVQINNIEIGSK